jgi:hypothetical protein
MLRFKLFLLCFLSFVIISFLFLPQNWIWAKTPAAPESIIRDRATQFYTALKNHQVDQAAKFIIKDLRKSFPSQPKDKFIDFRLGKVRREEGGQTALLEVIYTVSNIVPARLVETTNWVRWHWEGNNWFIDPASQKIKDPLDDARDRMYKRMSKSRSVPPLQLELEKTTFDFGITIAGKVFTARFPFTNHYAQEIKIAKVYDTPGTISNKTATLSIKPGEKGEIILEVNTSRMSMQYEGDVLVELQPICELVPLKIKGDVRRESKSPAAQK